ncbi:MAG: hypothetical protein ABWJ98_00035 [Hydrogenothermaceae bacterium]
MRLIFQNNMYIHIDEDGNVLGRYYYVFKEGYLKGVSDYFIATQQQCSDIKDLNKAKWSLYSTKTGKIAGDFDWIHTAGLVKSQSPYFKAQTGKYEALYTIDGQKTDFFEKIRDRGALTGESNYFWGKKNGKFAIYDVKTGEKLTEDYKSSVLAGVILGRGTYYVGSYGEEIFYIFDLKTGKRLTKAFDEHKLVEILKHGNLEKAVEEIGI